MNICSTAAPSRSVDRRAYRVDEFCEAHGICRSTLYTLVRDGRLKLIKIGGRSLIPVEESDRLLKGGA